MHRTIDLKKLKFRVQNVVSEEVMAAVLKPEIVIDQVTQDLIVTMTREIWSEKLGETSVSYPANWIEAVKERWLPRKWRHRWPVRYAVRKFEMFAMYPDYRPPAELGTHNFSIQETPTERC